MVMNIGIIKTFQKNERKVIYNNDHYYSFKIFPRFWLVKTTRIIYHNQLLLIRNFLILNRWRQKCSLLKVIEPLTSNIIETLTEKTWGWGCVKQKEKWLRVSLQVWAKKVFWMNNKAITEFGFRKRWRILQILEGVIHRSRNSQFISYSASFNNC